MLAVLTLIVAISFFVIAAFVCNIICRRLYDIEADIEALKDRTDIHFEHLSMLWRGAQKAAADTEKAENADKPEP